MKAARTLWVIGLIGILPSLAAGQSTNADLTVSASKEQVKPVYPVVEYKLELKNAPAPQKTEQIMRYGQISSQPWSEIVSRQQIWRDIHGLKSPEKALCLCLATF
jgi:hypothetical protein